VVFKDFHFWKKSLFCFTLLERRLYYNGEKEMFEEQLLKAMEKQNELLERLVLISESQKITEEKDLFTVKEVATKMNRSEQTIKRYVNILNISPVVAKNGKYKIRKDDVENMERVF